MKKSLFSLLKNKKSTSKGKEVSALNSEFMNSIDLDAQFEDMFPGEEPDVVKCYDLNGKEVAMK